MAAKPALDQMLNGEGFRFYRYDAGDGSEPVDLLSVTSIRNLCGESYNLVNWQMANLADAALGTMKRVVIGPRGGVKEVRQVFEFPSEFAQLYDASNGEQPKIDALRKWLREQADEPKNIAGVRGTITHEAIEKNIAWDRIERPYVEAAFAGLSHRDRTKVKRDINDEDVAFVRNSVRHYWHMRETLPMVILAREVRVLNLTAGYAGTFDALVWLLGTFNEAGGFIPLDIDRAKLPKAGEITVDTIRKFGGTLVLLDWKTSKGIYCMVPGTRVLTRALRWVPVEDLKVGDPLWAFTENRINEGRGGRRWQAGTVTGTGLTEAETLRITLQSGRTLTSTFDHPYLARRSSGGRALVEGGTIWLRADELRVGDTLPRYLDPWDEDVSYDAGWLSGIFDGEGCVNLSPSGFLRVSVAQKAGPVMDRIKALLTGRGFGYVERVNERANSLRITGGLSELARVLGSLQPIRLVPKFRATELQTPVNRRDRIVAIEPAGRQTVVNLTTSTGTFFAEGYGSHNTDQVVQAHAYLAAEFVVTDGVKDARLTALLEAAHLGGLVHIRPNGWGLHMFPFASEVVRAFLGSCAFARLIAKYPQPDAIFTHELKGASEEDDE